MDRLKYSIDEPNIDDLDQIARMLDKGEVSIILIARKDGSEIAARVLKCSIDKKSRGFWLLNGILLEGDYKNQKFEIEYNQRTHKSTLTIFF